MLSGGHTPSLNAIKNSWFAEGLLETPCNALKSAECVSEFSSNVF